VTYFRIKNLFQFGPLFSSQTEIFTLELGICFIRYH